MADIFHFVVPFLIELFFKGKDDQHFVDVLADLADAVFLPGPDLGRDIINDTQPLPAGPFGDTHIKAGVVYQDEGVGAVLEDIPFAEVDIAEDGPEVHQHFGEAHESKVFIVFDYFGARGLHQVTAPATDIGPGVLFF